MLRTISDCDKPPIIQGWQQLAPGLLTLDLGTAFLGAIYTGRHWKLFINDRDVTPEDWKPTSEWAAKRELLGLYREELEKALKTVQEEERKLNATSGN